MQEFLGKPLNLCTCFEAQTINDQFTDPRLTAACFQVLKFTAPALGIADF